MSKIFAAFFVVLVYISVLQAQTSIADAPKCSEEKAKIADYETKLKEWAQLNRYAADNLKIAAQAKRENKIVFFGDSITDGWNLRKYFPGKPFVNRGIGGQTTAQMLVRFRPDVIDLKPAAVVILAGTNDIAGNTGSTTPETIQNNLASMVELARAHNISVVLSSLLPVSDQVKNNEGKFIIQTKNRPPAQILALNAWLKRYAADNNLIYLDYYSAAVDGKGDLKTDLTYDGLHPNENGYKAMQPLAAQAVRAALNKQK